jgi:hypothetical protein
MHAESKRQLSPLTAPKAVAIVVGGSVLISVVMVILGQAVGKGIESVMIIHDYYIVLAIMSGAGFIGVLVFGSSQIGQQVQRYPDAINTLKVLALTAVASAFLIEITGTIGYIEYRLPDPDSAKSKILEIFPFAHEPMFETMEYVGLVGTIWTGLLAYLTWHFKERMITDTGVRNTMIVLIFLAIMYALVVSLMGIVPTKIASVQG